MVYVVAEDERDSEQLTAFRHYLMPDSEIVHDSLFEDAVCQVLAGRHMDLDETERDLLEPFLREDQPAYGAVDAVINRSAAEDDVHTVLQAAKRRRIAQHGYGDLSYILPTSNMVERFFSQTKLIQTDHSCSLLPSNFEALAFLKLNRAWWSRSLLVTENAKLPQDERL